jgi:DNA-binding MarR family transcriptional regulator
MVRIWARGDENAIADAMQWLSAATLEWQDCFANAADLVTRRAKYVNMADINLDAIPAQRAPADTRRKEPPAFDLIELLFFAYRDFVADADEVLAKFGFGRAHHRVLHFVNRNPGMKVAQLLDILNITKQSLGRVLKPLIDEGYVEQREGASDRRQRLLFVTAKGEALAVRLALLQTARFDRALAEIGAKDHEIARRFLIGMLNPGQRDGVLRLIDSADRARRRRP